MATLPLESDRHEIPDHVAIIMDGNGRWAKARGLPRVAGHKKGAESVRTAIKSAITLGVSYLTLYGFSSENWNRPEDEVKDLMGLLRFYLKSEIADLHKEGVRLRVIGDRSRLAGDIVAMIENAETMTADNVRLTLVIALSYGGRAEIASAVRAIAVEVAKGRLSPSDIDENIIADQLYTSGIPDPDLLIRTSGEQRVSNFLLWQMAYTEFVFIETLWPDFGHEEFERAVHEYHGRERRYGATGG